MAIPKIDLPTYKLHLKSSDKEITFRPFLVKEEKILLIALESNEYSVIIDAIKQVLSNCIVSDIKLEELPLFEIEHFLVRRNLADFYFVPSQLFYYMYIYIFIRDFMIKY